MYWTVQTQTLQLFIRLDSVLSRNCQFKPPIVTLKLASLKLRYFRSRRSIPPKKSLSR